MGVEDILGFGKFSEKLFDTLRDGGVALLRPWQTRRVGRAEIDVKVEEKLRLAAAEKDVEDIRSGVKVIDNNGVVVPAPILSLPTQGTSHSNPELDPETSELISDARSRLCYRELKREINLRAIALLARQEVITDEEVSEERVDGQWIARWIEGAQDISDDELRILWANLLAGEVKRPGTYSLRTIAHLHNMSVSEAKQIERVARRALTNFYDPEIPKTAFIYTHPFMIEDIEEMNAMKDIPLSEILELQEAGIINANGGEGFLATIDAVKLEDKNICILLFGENALYLELGGADGKLKLPIYRFTKLGAEIISLGTFTIDDEYLRKVIQGIKMEASRVFVLMKVKVIKGEMHYEQKVER